ncbi:arginine/serine-rich protein PNISR isoform X2 [Drosophila serrata]|uniref:arginine/serine-rich protein PNISR isoform X2 n=1 Tax=Drosophila serrata TaxID=7274 RepID=UPI000A1D399B|nr:arginine/serine-rich protein PNISR isoform X2 [Drosophila serrata]
MFPGGNGNADLGYNKHAHGHGHGHGHSHNQLLAQPPPPPPHFSLPTGGGPGIVNPLMATSLPLAMQGGAGIDWAQLAQQWIHMRDAGPAGVNMPVSTCPPPPVIGNVRDYHQQMSMPMPNMARAGYPILEEQGEADMDMDDDNERGHGAETPPPPAPMVTQSQWMALNETPALSVPASSEAAATLGKQQWSNWHTQPGKTPNTGNPTAHIPSLLKLNVSNPNEPHQQLQMQPSQHTAQSHQLATHQQHQQQLQHLQHQQHLDSGSAGGASGEIDANKRKMLPAWIREGLEKMEREKQRQLERQQSSSHVPSDTADAEIDVHVKQVSSKTLTTPVNLLNISNVASDSEDSIGLPAGVELGGELKEQQIGNELLSKAANGSSSSSDEEEQNESGSRTAGEKAATAAAKGDGDVNGKNYEERLADLMLVVRRTLTEILLETTNEEIAAIAGETLKAHRAKASSAQVIRKSALSSITGNLGLAAYGDSSSESEEDEDEEDGERQADAGKDVDKSVHLSAEELKARIRRSKRSFERVIDDIEDRVAKQEQRDEQTLQRHRKRELERSDTASEQRRPLPNSDSLGETASRPTHEKLQQYNGKRPSRKERTTRFSDNKDGKQQSQSYVQQVVAAAAVAPLPSVSSSSGPPKLKPVPNPATNLLQMPESVATMLSAADKALNKVSKSSRKSKSKRRHSSTSSSSSSSGESSSSSSDSDDSSSSSSDSGSKTSSNRSKRSSRHGHRSHGSSSRSKYNRRERHRERERERDRDRDRRHDRRHYSGGSSSSHRQGQRRHRGSSHSAEDDGASGTYHRSSRQSSSRGHDHGSSTSGRKRHRTRSRSKSRSTHKSSSNAYTSSSSASHSRKRH